MKQIKPTSPKLEQAIHSLKEAEKKLIKNLEEQLKILKSRNKLSARR